MVANVRFVSDESPASSLKEVVGDRQALNHDDEFLVPSQVTVGGQTYDLGLKVDLARLMPLLANQGSPSPPVVRTREAVDYFLEVKSGKKSSTQNTYRKRLNKFAAAFEFLPLDFDEIRRDYLHQYKCMSVKYQLSHHDLLTEFYNTIKGKFRLPERNPMASIERPSGAQAPKPNPLNSQWLPDLMRVVETDTELVALHIELGAGWRPCELLRIEAVDVRQALYRENPIILCHGKEREELTCVLPETLKLLAQVTPDTLPDHELVIRSRRIRAGVFQPMGETAHAHLIYGLFRRAGIPDGFTPYNLRDTFATMVYEASGDWFLMERLMRHILDGQGKAYARYSWAKLCQDLQHFSPLRLMQTRDFDSPPSPPAKNRALASGWSPFLFGSPGLTLKELR